MKIWIKWSDTFDGEWVTNSPQFRRYWGPVVGPASILLLDHLWLRGGMQAWSEVGVYELGQHIGVNKKRVMERTLDRLVHYQLADKNDTYEPMFEFARRVDPPPEHMYKRLPEGVKWELEQKEKRGIDVIRK